MNSFILILSTSFFQGEVDWVEKDVYGFPGT